MADEGHAERTVEPEEPKSRGGSRTWLWMILSLVVVGGFLVWLGMASEPTAVPVFEDENETESELAAGTVAVHKDSLATDKAAYLGQQIRVSDVEASSPLGPRIFWGELGDRTNQIPILVRLDSAAAEGWELSEGSAYSVTGEIFQMTDSVAADWQEKGEFTGEGEAMQATFTDYFIQASEIRRSRSRGSEGGTDGGAGAAGQAGASSSGGSASSDG